MMRTVLGIAVRVLPVFVIAMLSSVALAAGRPVPAPAAFFPSTPDPNTVYVYNVSESGSGCPAGSFVVNTTPDGSQIELGFSDFVAATDSILDMRKNCLITFAVHVPSGYSFALVQADYNGFAQLDPGVTAKQQTSYFFAGTPTYTTTLSLTSNSLTHTSAFGTTTTTDDFLNGDTYSSADLLPITALVWSRCGVDVLANVNSSINVQNARATPPANQGIIELDEADFSAVLVYHIVWQTC